MKIVKADRKIYMLWAPMSRSINAPAPIGQRGIEKIALSPFGNPSPDLLFLTGAS